MEINFKHYDSIYCLESSSGEILNKKGQYFEFLHSFDVRRESDAMFSIERLYYNNVVFLSDLEIFLYTHSFFTKSVSKDFRIRHFEWNPKAAYGDGAFVPGCYANFRHMLDIFMFNDKKVQIGDFAKCFRGKWIPKVVKY